MKFVQSPMLNTWKEELLEKAGIRILGYGEFVRGPYRTLLSTRPVLKLEDVQGLKLRMYKSEMVMSIWKELGANVIYLAQAETYEGLKRGLVEAATFPIANIETMHFQEVAKFILQTNEFPQSVGFFVNEKAYQSLPEDLKKILLKAYEKSCGYTQANMEKAAEESLDRMIRKDKVTFIRTPMDAFREKVKPLYRKWEAEGKYGLKKGIIDDIAGL